MQLYRAVSPQELADISNFAGFRAISASMEGKWFAESFTHAVVWGRALYRPDQPFNVVQVDLPEDIANLLFRIPLLDQIGPARYADEIALQLLNQGNLGIKEIPLGGGP
jgi:hypothetical protein